MPAGGLAGPASRRLDLLPEFLPRSALGLGQFAEGRLAAHALYKKRRTASADLKEK
jgi:hypothetical protein